LIRGLADVLSDAEASLVERDRVIPGLATLLDPDAFVDALHRRIPAAGFRGARITYIRYKPRTNCLVGFRLELAHTTVAATAKAYQRTPALYHRLSQHVTPPLAAWNAGRLFLDDCGVLLSVFPHDRKITSLPRLPRADARSRMIRRVVGRHRAPLHEGALEELAYKPERRYVAKLSVSREPRAVLKFYTERNYQTAWNSSAAFESRGMLRVAPRIGNSDRYGVLAFEWLPGRLLRDAMLEPNADFGMLRAVGAAAVELHAQNASGLGYRGRKAEAAALVCEAERLGFLCPHLSKRARDLAERLADRLVHEAATSCPIHGDFHAGQVLLEGGNIGLVDLDRAIRASPMGDLGLFIAHLDREVLRRNLQRGQADRLTASLLEGYFHPRPTELARVNLYRAAALLQLAPECFRHHEPDWPERIEAMLQKAGEIAEFT
jgi:hypothetical protein